MSFCSNCGRQIENNETCECRKVMSTNQNGTIDPANNPSTEGKTTSKTVESVLNDAIKNFKNFFMGDPFEVTKRTSTFEAPIWVVYLLVQMILTALFFMAVTKGGLSQISKSLVKATGFYVNDATILSQFDLSYWKIGLCGFFSFALMFFSIVLLVMGVGSMSKQKLESKKILNIVSISFLPFAAAASAGILFAFFFSAFSFLLLFTGIVISHIILYCSIQEIILVKKYLIWYFTGCVLVVSLILWVTIFKIMI